MALEDFLPALADRIGQISGLDGNVYFPDPDGGPRDLPATTIVTPCAVLLPIEGIQMFGGSFVATHALKIVIYACPSFAPTTLGRAIPYIKRMRNKLGAHIKIGLSSVEHNVLQNSKFYEGPKGITYAEKPYTGVEFFTEVKEIDVFTVDA